MVKFFSSFLLLVIMNLPNKDKKILNELIKNGRISLDKLSRKTGFPVSTIHRRIKLLEKKMLIKGYEPVIDYSKLGYTVTVFLTVDLHEGVDTKNTIRSFGHLSNVIEIDLVQGSDFDVLLKARCKDLKEVDLLIKEVMQVEGVEEVDSIISGISEKETLVFPV